nr:hypothetical protein [Pseudomonas kitaguniensis]
MSSRAGVQVSATQLDNSDGGLVIAGSGLNLTADQCSTATKG